MKFSEIGNEVKETVVNGRYDQSTLTDDVIFSEQFKRVKRAMTRQLFVELLKQEAKRSGKPAKEVLKNFVTDLNHSFQTSFVENGFIQFNTDKDRAVLDYMVQLGFSLFSDELVKLTEDVVK